mgnify:CR=1 FL=1
MAIPGYCTTKEAAERMGVSMIYLKHIVNVWGFPTCRLRGSPTLLYEEALLDKYIATHPYLGKNRKTK